MDGMLLQCIHKHAPAVHKTDDDSQLRGNGCLWSTTQDIWQWLLQLCFGKMTDDDDDDDDNDNDIVHLNI